MALKIWWSNSIFFVSVHLATFIGLYFRPFYAVSKSSLILAFISWQLAGVGITVGYHRLYSHRAFHATFGVRLVLAALGSAAFQGSIKASVFATDFIMQRYTDSDHDPYSATRGLFYSHMGWIFVKPTYERIELVDREDLDKDPIVRFQHKYYVPLALFFGFILPPLLGSLWGDVSGAFVWGALVSRLAIWHATFLVNSLAHWDGLQPYSDEDTSRGNLLLAILTGGEGNHNFHVRYIVSCGDPRTEYPQHAFPHDFRSGPSMLDWDPSKWIILILHRFGLAMGLRRARVDDMAEAKAYMEQKSQQGVSDSEDHELKEWQGEVWNTGDLEEYVNGKPGRCVVLVDGFVVDVTEYLAEHPGGAKLLRNYSVRLKDNLTHDWRNASWAFDGGLNNHSRAARRRMREFRIAKFRD